MVAGEDAQLSLRFGTKSPRAFRTIAEVAEELAVPQHVLRFWESKFPQVRPLKRRGGRRYYRPEDVLLLRRIQGLLYGEGYTIRGAQKLLREKSTRAATAEQPATSATEALEDSDIAPEPPAQAPGVSPENRAVLRSILAELEAVSADLQAIVRR
ncbi:MAG: MerR family transcriptional regulator [Rhodospirillales bacterium]|nr:MerR family transcriptional regulator [Rhodospirillales bacterium]